MMVARKNYFMIVILTTLLDLAWKKTHEVAGRWPDTGDEIETAISTTIATEFCYDESVSKVITVSVS